MSKIFGSLLLFILLTPLHEFVEEVNSDLNLL